MCFHGLRAVAPLKAIVPAMIMRFDPAFPRPQSRGPIEGNKGRLRVTPSPCVSTASEPWPH